jgi:hypothetical protein
MYSVAVMNGYFTVRALSASLSACERIACETRYVQAMAEMVGGHEALRALCLNAAAGGEGASPAKASLLGARAAAEAAIRTGREIPADCRFVVEAWTATDL